MPNKLTTTTHQALNRFSTVFNEITGKALVDRSTTRQPAKSASHITLDIFGYIGIYLLIAKLMAKLIA